MKRLFIALALTLAAGPCWAQAKMTIATGVDPAFSQFYVAKEAGLFAKNGLDVTVNTGASGSAMVPFLVNDQINAAYGSDLAGVINHGISPDIVAVADGTLLVKWESVVGRNVADLAGLKGKKIGVTKGTGAEIFWQSVERKFNLNPADYTILDIEAPEMVAALERGDIDAFAVWEPWPTRATMSVAGAKILVDAEGLVHNRNFIYMNRSWIEKNRDTAERFMRALCEANDLINSDRPAAVKMVAKFLSMPPALAAELMPKLEYDMFLKDESLVAVKDSEDLLRSRGKLKAPLDYGAYIDTELLKAVRPDSVAISHMPGK
jgi:ABC-type nitrate/sulfonate/bicarbonate transport system substrate-binding protein